MTRICRSFVPALVLGTLFVALAGCQKKEGPAERVGREMDKAAEKTGRQLEKAADKVGEKLEDAGAKIKDAAKDVKK